MRPDIEIPRFVPEGPADFIQIPKPHIIAIRRDQMPEDIRSAFLPGDIILFRGSTRRSFPAREMRPKARGDTLLPCPWCRADDIFTGLLLAVTVLLCLEAAFAQDSEAYAIETLSSSVAVLVTSPVVFILDFLFARGGTEVYDSVTPRCPEGVVGPHRVRSLVSHVLGPSTLLLLEQPTLNLQSFWYYYRFFNAGQAGSLSDQEVDICIRHQLEVPEGLVFLDGLIGNGPRALVGLEPCKGIATDAWCVFAWATAFYRSYRDWKRWRLAALACRRLQVQAGGLFQQDGMKGCNALEGLGGSGGHTWLLVDPTLFSSRAPSRPRNA